jgi:hypothetical protein
LTAGVTYWVQVNAAASSGYLASTGQAGSAIATLVLGAPTNVSGTAATTTTMNVSWTNAANDPAGSNGYTIYACTNNTFTTGCVTTIVNTAGSTGTTNTLAASTEYYVEVKENASTGYIVSAWGIDSTEDES